MIQPTFVVHFEWSLGDVIRRYRKLRGLTQEQVGRAVGLDKSAVSKAEGSGAKSDLRTLEKLAKGLGVPMTAFYERLEEAQWGALLRNLPASVRNLILDVVHEQLRDLATVESEIARVLQPEFGGAAATEGTPESGPTDQEE